MKPGVNGVNPFTIIGYEPQLTFTGTSIMGVNPETGKFNSHADTWDAIENQRYLSLEAVGHLVNQLGDLKKGPKGLASPPYSVLKKRAMYEIRRYAPFAVAETNMKGQGSSGMSMEGQGNAFQALAGYIFGENQGGQKMEMTTPVFNDAQGDKMQFYISPPQVANNSNAGTSSPSASTNSMSAVLPEPTNASVSTRMVGGGLYAAVSFGGLALPDEAREIELKLRDALSRDGVVVVDKNNIIMNGDKDVLIARYNEPWSNPVTRKNEILIKLDEGSFQLW